MSKSKQKTLGQVAFDARYEGGIVWGESPFIGNWERAAKAVIREYLKREKAKKGAKK